MYDTECVVYDTECVVYDTECVVYDTECVVYDTECVVYDTECVVYDTECGGSVNLFVRWSVQLRVTWYKQTTLDSHVRRVPGFLLRHW